MVPLFIDTPQGRVTIECDKTDTILTIKETIEDITGVPVEKQKLSFIGTQFENDRTIESYIIPIKLEVEE